MHQQRDVQLLLVQPLAVVHDTVFAQALPVIGGQYDHRTLPQSRPLKLGDEPFEVVIDSQDLAVVARDLVRQRLHRAPPRAKIGIVMR